MNSGDGLSCLRFCVRHRADVDDLAEHGEPPHGANPSDWAKFVRVLDLAHAQAGSLLSELVEKAYVVLKPTGVRAQSVSRPKTAADRWEATSRIRVARSRTDFGHLGVNLGLTSELGTGLHVFFGHARQRFVRGAALHEVLRRRGAKVALADGRSGSRDWVRGTLILGALPFTGTTSRQDCVQFVERAVRDSLLLHWPLIASAEAAATPE